ncbi:MAG: hypothetical protein GY751_15170 [Bacteroidetes bacterium]|nr:hypothetical protein [Bacteroidota bacterium]
MKRKDEFSNRHQPIDDLSTKGGHLMLADFLQTLDDLKKKLVRVKRFTNLNGNVKASTVFRVSPCHK